MDRDEETEPRLPQAAVVPQGAWSHWAGPGAESSGGGK